MEGPLVPINPEMLDSMKTILLLDDHAMVREAFAAVIRERMPHARLLLMPTSVQALILMSRIASIDVIVTDYHMPGIEGAELLRRIAAERPDVPIVVMCSTCRQADVDDAFACGAAAVIHQSSNGSVFIDTLRRVLAGERCISAGDWDAPPPIAGHCALNAAWRFSRRVRRKCWRSSAKAFASVRLPRDCQPRKPR
ncbi:response regulator [Pandoraea pnomenusa]|uniref:response regulator n=1 Tax=Pandoraea pnomenusa TaxID=93220 RepID=UPI0007BCE265|nr:response regulator transcription factor [Pandoraea pnomenusa]ANC45525.1 hypothetical protein A6P55_16395 [Pandoraea pnomenusa]